MTGRRVWRMRAGPLAALLSGLLVGCGGSTTTPAPAATTGSVRPASSVPSASVRGNPSPVDVAFTLTEFPVTAGSHPHDVAPAADGGVWYSGQQNGTLGHLDPSSGTVREIRLGDGSAPHGVIVGQDGAPWLTDGGLNAIVRVDPDTERVTVYPLPATHPAANLNTAVFDSSGILWFTGQSGALGRLDPADGKLETWDAPRGRGPYGITTTPDGAVWYASLAGSHIARIDPATREVTPVDPPTPGQGARRIWSDSRGRLWIAEWNAGQVGMHDPSSGAWREWRLPGDGPQAYAVYVDDRDVIWLTDFGSNAIVRFDPASETFTSVELPSSDGAVRQLLGRAGEVWGAESAVDRLIVARSR